MPVFVILVWLFASSGLRDLSKETRKRILSVTVSVFLTMALIFLQYRYGSRAYSHTESGVSQAELITVPSYSGKQITTTTYARAYAPGYTFSTHLCTGPNVKNKSICNKEIHSNYPRLQVVTFIIVLLCWYIVLFVLKCRNLAINQLLGFLSTFLH